MDIPTYVKMSDQENFIQALVQTLRDGVSDNGFVIPALPQADIITLANMDPAIFDPGVLWFDTDLSKLVFMSALPTYNPVTHAVITTAVLEQITSVAIVY